MKWIRATVNAMLVATLIKPTLRWTIARWRRQAREYADTAVIIPAHELIEAALPAGMLAADSSLEPDSDELEEVATRGGLRTLLILGLVAAGVAASVVVVTAVVRRRRASVAREPVAVPIEVPESVDDRAAARESAPIGSSAE